MLLLPAESDLADPNLDEENHPEGQYVQQRVKVNEALRGTEESVRMRTWLPPKTKEENQKVLELLGLAEEAKKNKSGFDFTREANEKEEVKKPQTENVEMADETVLGEIATDQEPLENLDTQKAQENIQTKI